MNNKRFSCCFTGHRCVPEKIKKDLTARLKSEIEKLINDGYLWFYVGGAVGFDCLATEVLCSLKEKYDHIKLVLILPNQSYRKKWLENEIKAYEFLESKVDDVQYVSSEYYRGCMQTRDRELVDKSSVCISFLNSPEGGTAYTVKYAMKKGLRIINLGDEEKVEYIFEPMLKDNLVLPDY